MEFGKNGTAGNILDKIMFLLLVLINGRVNVCVSLCHPLRSLTVLSAAEHPKPYLNLERQSIFSSRAKWKRKMIKRGGRGQRRWRNGLEFTSHPCWVWGKGKNARAIWWINERHLFSATSSLGFFSPYIVKANSQQVLSRMHIWVS